MIMICIITSRDTIVMSWGCCIDSEMKKIVGCGENGIIKEDELIVEWSS